MRSFLSKLLVFAFILAAVAVVSADEPPRPKSQEMSDFEGVPVLVKHLPEWESKRENVKFFSDDAVFREFFRDRKIVGKVDFFTGTEAVFAQYEQGKLLIIEYTTPQASVAVDKLVLEAEPTGDYIYRRIGNYNVFLFDPVSPSDPVAANALLDQIKYQKIVTWPYGDPTGYFQKERDFILGTKSLFINTVIFILVWLVLAIILGLCLGILYFRSAERRRARMAAFSDAGGLTRLNLDGLSADLSKLIDD